MSDDKLIPPPAFEDSVHVPVRHAGAAPMYGSESQYPMLEGDEPGLDIRRYLFAILRYKWLLVVAMLLGSAGAYFVWTTTELSYTAQSSLWIENQTSSNAGDVGPIRTGGLLQDAAWVQLLRSNQVLDTVVIRERLFLEVAEEYAPAFERFDLMPQFRPDEYELRVSDSGEDFVLTAGGGALVQQGSFGGPIGENTGFRWAPAQGSFEPGAVVPFTVRTVRAAAAGLDARMAASIDREGNFLRLSLDGRSPERIASVLNSVMERHVDLAAELKSQKLDETLLILEEQLNHMEQQLAQAERDLEVFRVTTISLPSDQTAIAAGLQITRNPVFANYFDMKVQVEQFRRDRTRLEDIAAGFGEGPVRIEALEAVQPAAESSELRRILNDLVEARSQLRVLRDKYSDEYAPVQELLGQIASIEQEAIPRVVAGIIDQLTIREMEMQGLVTSAETELEAIPPRTIEEGRLARRVATTENLYQEIRGRVETARLASASSIPDVRILDEAVAPNSPSNDPRLPTAAMIFFGCLGAAMGGAILLDRMDARFRYASDVSRDIGVDILGSIPRIESGKGRRGVLNAAQALEAFRELRIHVGFAYGNAGPITLAVTSPSQGEGKSLVSSNLAVAFSEVGKRTLLIDGDTRRGDAHRLLGRERSPGLIDYLRERTDEEIIQATDHPNLDFIGSGSRGVSTPELLASPRMAYFMGTLKRTYDVIIVDCPPLASGGDPLILGSLTGNMAVVIRTGSTEKALAQAKLDQLGRLPIRILGAVLNDVSASDSYNSYYSSYLPSYEPVPEEGDEDGRAVLSWGGPSEESGE